MRAISAVKTILLTLTIWCVALTASAQEKSGAGDTVLVSKQALTAAIKTMQEAAEKEYADAENIKTQLASPILTGAEKVQLQLQLEIIREKSLQRSGAVAAFQAVLSDPALRIGEAAGEKGRGGAVEKKKSETNEKSK